MASHSVRPTLDLAAGREVLEQDLQAAADFFGGDPIQAHGWRRLGSRGLLIPLTGRLQDQEEDAYLLKLEFMAGREWPPSAQFVNPETNAFAGLADQHHLPRIESPEVRVHAQYGSPHHTQPIQLICCSATLEYYDVLHGGNDAYLWRPTDTFLITLDAIRRALTAHYSGRWPRHDA